ncbi:MAG: ABC transporter ATP-binding protein [Pseudomonadota bacterium]
MSAPLLKLEDLTKYYQEAGRAHGVLENLQLVVVPGEIIALVGRSGSGKSTLLNLIAGIDAPSRGRVAIAGSEITSLNEHQRTLFRRRHIGFIFQFFNLIPTLTVQENLLLPLELIGMGGDEADRRAGNLLERIGLVQRADTYPDRLSGGEQQRVALARALIHQPSLLLADEPTGNLDAETGRLVISLLIELAREHAMTVLLVTHSAEVAAAADRICTLRAGQLFEESR